jgi:hypothetical protein
MGCNQYSSIWDEEKTTFLIENYAKQGKMWCVEKLGMLEHQVRYKSSRLKLKSRGVSEAWKKKQVEHAAKLTGRKRPEQSAVIKRVIHDKGIRPSQETIDLKAKKLSAYFKEHGHPKGMLGKKHSLESKEKMSDSGFRRHALETEDEISDRTMKMLKTKSDRGNIVNPRPMASWKCGWREVGGQRCYFRSAWEANYARYLQFLLEKKQILKWEHEPETFWFESIKRGCRSYLPDFRVTECNNSIAYHEVKGWMDDRSKTKINRMRIYHPQVLLIVIDSKAYKELQKKISMMIDGWE